MYTIDQKTKEALFNLLTSVDFDLKRIVIAEHEIDANVITLLLEDSQNIAPSFAECLHLEISLEEFAKLISKKGHNSYEGTKKTESGRYYKGRVEIAEPIKFYTNDATPFHQKCIREELLEEVLNELIASIVHG